MKILRITSLVVAVGFFVACCSAQTAKPRAAQTAKPRPAAPAETRGTGHSGVELWKAVSPAAAPLRLAEAELTPVQLGTIQHLLAERTEADGWGCEDDVPESDWIADLTYWQLPLTPTVRTIFVEAGNTCGRSGENSPNGAMWIIIFHGNEAVLLATPQESLNGALYAVLPARTHSLPDLVVTWRVNDMESDLTYLRFDGVTYTAVLGAKKLESPNAPPRIVPTITPKE